MSRGRERRLPGRCAWASTRGRPRRVAGSSEVVAEHVGVGVEFDQALGVAFPSERLQAQPCRHQSGLVHAGNAARVEQPRRVVRRELPDPRQRHAGIVCDRSIRQDFPGDFPQHLPEVAERGRVSGQQWEFRALWSQHLPHLVETKAEVDQPSGVAEEHEVPHVVDAIAGCGALRLGEQPDLVVGGQQRDGEGRTDRLRGRLPVLRLHGPSRLLSRLARRGRARGRARADQKRSAANRSAATSVSPSARRATRYPKRRP